MSKSGSGESSLIFNVAANPLYSLPPVPSTTLSFTGSVREPLSETFVLMSIVCGVE